MHTHDEKLSVATKAEGAIKKSEGAITGNAAKKPSPRRRMANGASDQMVSQEVDGVGWGSMIHSSQISQYSGLAVTIGSLVKPCIHRSLYSSLLTTLPAKLSLAARVARGDAPFTGSPQDQSTQPSQQINRQAPKHVSVNHTRHQDTVKQHGKSTHRFLRASSRA
ncbi:hypothetical protein HYALB_00013674 [Hymenoscyphus albidus]|uniref:Uncharacterized protein n=1 Tax=Hymenoscyphus albidus TaxID=595503 RepID=A0A9N9LXC4_9HELO|nr:hypothetical protein HYALB_00013674 [Hymenoscyphus albidus]